MLSLKKRAEMMVKAVRNIHSQSVRSFYARISALSSPHASENICQQLETFGFCSSRSRRVVLKHSQCVCPTDGCVVECLFGGVCCGQRGRRKELTCVCNLELCMHSVNIKGKLRESLQLCRFLFLFLSFRSFLPSALR